MVSTGTAVSGGVSSIKKEVSLSRSHSDSDRRNRRGPGNDVVRQFASSDELEKLQVRWLTCTSSGLAGEQQQYQPELLCGCAVLDEMHTSV